LPFQVSRSHFANHYHCDPWASPQSVFVIRDWQGVKTEADFVSTLRVFRRRIYSAGGQVSCGGIGEVCTREDFRRKGLVRRLFHEVEKSMEEEDLELLSLHSSQMVAVYQSMGFRSVPLPIVGRRFEVQAARSQGQTEKQAIIHAADLENDALVDELIKVHHSFHNGRFEGVVVRDRKQ